MKLVMKKSLSVLLSVLLAFSVFGVLAFAADTDDVIEDDEAVVDEIEEVEEEPDVCEYCGEIHNTNKLDGFITDFVHDVLFVVKAILGAPAKAVEEETEAEAEEPEAEEPAEEPEEADVCEYCGETHNTNSIEGFITDFLHDFLFIVKSLVIGFAHFFDAPAPEAETAAE